MPVSIISNLSSKMAMSSLQTNNENLTKTITKLSSGQRVFSAAEDASALGVGASLSVELAALQSASINTTTATSTLQIVEGAMNEISDILSRMNTLASQASSGQYSNTEREMVDAEFQLLIEEIDRIANDTEFDGQGLLTGDALYAVTYGASIQADGVSEPEFNSSTVTSDATFRYTYDSLNEELTVTRIDGGVVGSQTIDLTAMLDDVAGVGQNLSAGESIDVSFSGVGVSFVLDDAFDRHADIMETVTDNTGADIAFTFAAAVPPATVETPVTFNNSGVTQETADALVALDAATTEYNLASGMLTLDVQTDGAAVTLGGVAGVRYAVNGGALSADGADSADLVSAPGYVDIYLTTASGTENIMRVSYDSLTTSGTTDGTMSVPLGKGLFSAAYSATGGSVDLEFMIGTNSNSAEDLLNVVIDPMTAEALGLTTLSTTTVANAETALNQLAFISENVNVMRASVGASLSRLEFVSVKLSNDIENTATARSAFLDADTAAEITNMATEEALVELSMTMLSRANQMPQRILQLLE